MAEARGTRTREAGAVVLLALVAQKIEQGLAKIHDIAEAERIPETVYAEVLRRPGLMDKLKSLFKR